MTNIASVLKSEISRIARKEVRAEMDSLKKASSQYRSAIAELKRQVSGLQKQLNQTTRQARNTSKVEAESGSITPRRFSATRLAAHRAKLGLSAASYGKLVGIGGQTIYNWEQGKSRPNAEQLQQLAAVRALGKRAALDRAGELNRPGFPRHF